MPKQIILVTLAVCSVLLASLMLVTFVCIGTSFTVQNNFSKKKKKAKQNEKKNPINLMQFNLHNYKKCCKIILAPRECLVILDISKMKRKANY